MSSILSHVQVVSPGSFTPADTLDLSSYSPTRGWNFAKLSTITYSGGLVSSVAGTWGTSTALTQSGATTLRPAVGSRSINGYHALDFDGSSDYMQDTTYIMGGTGSGGYATQSYVWVMYLDAATGNAVGASATNGLCVQTGSTMNLNAQGASVISAMNGVSVSANTAYVVGVTYRNTSNGSDVYWWVNGTTETDSHGTNLGGAGSLRVGLGAGTEYLNGMLGMLAIWTPALSTSTLGTVCSEVKTAWGI